MSNTSSTPKIIIGLLAKDQHQNTYQAFNLEYLNEGGANAVYRIINVQNTKNPESTSIIPALTLQTTLEVTSLHQKVLRLRKEVADAESVEQNVKNYKSVMEAIGPLHPDSQALLLTPTLLRINDTLKLKVSKNLHDLSQAGLRKRDRSGGIDMREDSAMLLDDMSCKANHDYLNLEFKLKWLAPSPSAPADATCCRTCALTAMKMLAESKQRRNKGKRPKMRSCPLGHFVGDEMYRCRLLDEILSFSDNVEVEEEEKEKDNDKEKEKEKEEVDYEQCIAWLHSLRSLELIQSLRKAQIALDEKGSLDEEYMATREFRIAMTLRDCSIFAQIPKKKTEKDIADEGMREGEGVKFAIADLDLKPDSREKRAYWRDVERRLIDGGYYILSSEELGAMGIRCFLREYNKIVRNGELE